MRRVTAHRHHRAAPPGLEAWHQLAQQVERPGDIHPQAGVPVLQRQRLNRRQAQYAGDTGQHINHPMGTQQFMAGLLHRLGIADIQHIAGKAVILLGEAQVEADHLPAQLGKTLRHAAADALAGTGDPDGLTAEIHLPVHLFAPYQTCSTCASLCSTRLSRKWQKSASRG
ncbi:hypothetical protein D9M68_750830 [compost metagenome]